MPDPGSGSSGVHDDSPLLTARAGGQRFVVQAVTAELIGATVVIDVRFSNDETVTLRIERGKARLLSNELIRVLSQG